MGVIMKKFFKYMLLSAMISSSVAFGMSDQSVAAENSNEPGKIKSALILLKNKIVENKRTLAVVAGSGVVAAAVAVGCVKGYSYLESIKNFVNTLGQAKDALNTMQQIYTDFMASNMMIVKSLETNSKELNLLKTQQKNNDSISWNKLFIAYGPTVFPLLMNALTTPNKK